MAWAANWDLGSKHAASLPTWIHAGQSAHFLQMQGAMGKSDGKKLRCFMLWKITGGPTLNSSPSQVCRSAGVILICLTLGQDGWWQNIAWPWHWGAGEGIPWCPVKNSLCQGLGKWEVVIISIGLTENLFVLTVKKVFMKLTRNKNWRGILLLLMCLIC